jgi:hypothetical protein
MINSATYRFTFCKFYMFYMFNSAVSYVAMKLSKLFCHIVS